MMPSAQVSAADLTSLLPVLILALGGLVVLLVDALVGPKGRIPWVALSAPIPLLALLTYITRWSNLGGIGPFGGMHLDDAFGAYIGILVCLGTLFALVLSEDYLRHRGRYRGDYFALVLFSASGLILFSSSREILTLFLGLELLSIPIYILSGFMRQDPRSVEASMKYFLLGALSSAIFLMGGAFLYAASGTLDLAQALSGGTGGAIRQIGLLLLMTGFLFKIGAVPFHMWTPDVYEGAPTAVTAFMITAVKAAAFGAFARILALVQPAGALAHLAPILGWISVLTMTVGNVAALTQSNVKRMLAYSSIAHAGYMLIGLTVFAGTGDPAALSGILFYLLAYALMNIGAFAVVILWSDTAEERLEMSDWAGLGWKRPKAALALSVFMISLSGIPPTAGFLGKYAIFRNAVGHGFGWLIVIAVLNSALSVYYYLRVLVLLYMREPVGLPARSNSLLLGLVAALCVAGTLWIGFAPDTFVPGVPALLSLVRQSVLTLR
jgi:NADH-quinone oxidoreductase subunit N